jgi:hypothetical protein
MRHTTQLDLKYKLPKMRYKGETVEVQRIRVDKKRLVTEIKEVEEPPTFPLVTKKRPPTVAPPPAAAKSGTGGRAGGNMTGGGSEQGPSAAAASTSVRSAAAAAAPDGGDGEGRVIRQCGEVQFEGRPVVAMVLEFQLPCGAPAATSNGVGGGGVRGDDVRVEVCGQRVCVSAPGSRECRVQLPLAASAKVRHPTALMILRSRHALCV